MNDKKIINKKLGELYQTFIQKNYCKVYNEFFDFNIKLGEFRENINILLRKLAEILILKLKEQKTSYYTEDKNYSYKICLFKEFERLEGSIINIDVPVFKSNLEIVSVKILEYCITNNIPVDMIFSKVVKSSILKLKVYSLEDTKRIVSLFEKDADLKKEVFSRTIPFLPQKNYLGFYIEYEPYSFKTEYIKNLVDFFSYNNEEDINLENFENFIYRKYKSETNVNYRRMLEHLYRSISMINKESNLYEMLDNNTTMDLSSFSQNDYLLKLDQNKLVYFVNKMDSSEVRFTDEHYLNIAYSKYYENIIKNSKNEDAYRKFYTIYSRLITSNYKDMSNFSLIINDNGDEISKTIALLASGFFAYKKMGLDINTVYMIMYKYLNKTLGIEMEIQEPTDTKTIIKKNILPFSQEYLNKVIDLKDNKKSVVKNYLEENNILEQIPLEAVVYMKDGSIIKGKDFVNQLYKHTDKYENFEELKNALIDLIEYN